MKIGTIVTYTTEEIPCDPRSGKESYCLEYPAILYKIIDWDTTKEIYTGGLYVFMDEGMRLMRKVTYSSDPKPNTWR